MDPRETDIRPPVVELPLVELPVVEQPGGQMPEDVAALYSWANLDGAKYRDFSASRREYRAQMRYRAAKALCERELRAQAEAEASAEAAERAASVAEAAAQSQDGSESEAVRLHAMRSAEAAARRAAEARLEASRRAEAAAQAEMVAQREEREIAEAHASALRKASQSEATQSQATGYSEARRARGYRPDNASGLWEVHRAEKAEGVANGVSRTPKSGAEASTMPEILPDLDLSRVDEYMPDRLSRDSAPTMWRRLRGSIWGRTPTRDFLPAWSRILIGNQSLISTSIRSLILILRVRWWGRPGCTLRRVWRRRRLDRHRWWRSRTVEIRCRTRGSGWRRGGPR